jgi:hypothetical protein
MVQIGFGRHALAALIDVPLRSEMIGARQLNDGVHGLIPFLLDLLIGADPSSP